MIDFWQYCEYTLDSKYARVLHMLGLHMVLNKIIHTRYLTGFLLNRPWVLNMPVLYRVSVENGTSYMFDRLLSIPRILSMLGLEYTRVVKMSMLRRVLCKLYFKDSRLFFNSWVLNMLRLWMYQESKYAIVTKGSELNTSLYIFERVLNIPLFQVY